MCIHICIVCIHICLVCVCRRVMLFLCVLSVLMYIISRNKCLITNLLSSQVLFVYLNSQYPITASLGTPLLNHNSASPHQIPDNLAITCQQFIMPYKPHTYSKKLGLIPHYLQYKMLLTHTTTIMPDSYTFCSREFQRITCKIKPNLK